MLKVQHIAAFSLAPTATPWLLNHEVRTGSGTVFKEVKIIAWEETVAVILRLSSGNVDRNPYLNMYH